MPFILSVKFIVILLLAVVIANAIKKAECNLKKPCCCVLNMSLSVLMLPHSVCFVSSGFCRMASVPVIWIKHDVNVLSVVLLEVHLCKLLGEKNNNTAAPFRLVWFASVLTDVRASEVSWIINAHVWTDLIALLEQRRGIFVGKTSVQQYDGASERPAESRDCDVNKLASRLGLKTEHDGPAAGSTVLL